MASAPDGDRGVRPQGCLVLAAAWFVWPVVLGQRLRSRRLWDRLSDEGRWVCSVDAANPARVVVTFLDGTHDVFEPSGVQSGTVHRFEQSFSGFHQTETDYVLELVVDGRRHVWVGTRRPDCDDLGPMAERWLGALEGLRPRDHSVDPPGTLADVVFGTVWAFVVGMVLLFAFG